MIRVFSPSNEPHVWRQTWALVAIAFWTMVLFYALLHGPVFWLLRIGGWDWSFVPVTA